MIQDYEQELTVAGGHNTNFAAGSEYGTKPYDKKGSHDANTGEPIHAFMQILGADVDNLTSLKIDIVDSTTGASGGTETVVGSRTFLLADLTQAAGVRRIDILNPGLAARRYLAAKLTVAGTTPTAGALCKVWLAKATDVAPQNAGVNIG